MINRVTNPTNTPANPGASLNMKGFIFTGSLGSSARPDQNMYFLNANQKRLYDGIEKGFSKMFKDLDLNLDCG